MSREIKFRAWDTIESEGFKRPIMYDWDYLKTWEAKSWFQKGVYLMQFTGLLDKNGKEIYEGDILENKKSSKGNFFVKFNVGGYDAVYKGNFTLCLHPVLHEYEGAEIIGNIYSNPDLLTN